MVVIIFSTVFFGASSLPAPIWSDDMAIDFTADGQYVDWPSGLSIPIVDGYSICARVYPDSYGFGSAGNFKTILATYGASGGFGLYIDKGLQKFALITAKGFVNPGIWEFSGITLSAWQHVCVTYNPTSAANDPIAYINGSPVATTEISTPIAEQVFSVTAARISDSADYTVDGKIALARVYNRILTAAEVAELYAMNALKDDHRNLIFDANLIRAAGVQNFSGATLGASNYIYDRVSGTAGTITGAPSGVSDTTDR
jgi:hypothetical protein